MLTKRQKETSSERQLEDIFSDSTYHCPLPGGDKFRRPCDFHHFSAQTSELVEFKVQSISLEVLETLPVVHKIWEFLRQSLALFPILLYSCLNYLTHVSYEQYIT